jgi:hypothetical protein
VDPHHLGADGAEHQFAGGPGVFETAAGAAVIKAIEKHAVRA